MSLLTISLKHHPDGFTASLEVGLSLRKITGNTNMDTPIDLYTRLNSFHVFLDNEDTT